MVGSNLHPDDVKLLSWSERGTVNPNTNKQSWGRFRTKLNIEKSNLLGFKVHRPSSMGTKLLFYVIKATINQSNVILTLGRSFGATALSRRRARQGPWPCIQGNKPKWDREETTTKTRAFFELTGFFWIHVFTRTFLTGWNECHITFETWEPIFQTFFWTSKNPCLPPPHNQIYSRFWYAFSLFLSEFHSVHPFNGNFCEPGRARFAEKKMEFPSQVVSKKYSTLFSAKFGPFSNSFRGRVSAVHDKRTEWTCSRNVFVVKCETPPVLRWKLCEFQDRKSISISGINLIVWRGLVPAKSI